MNAPLVMKKFLLFLYFSLCYLKPCGKYKQKQRKFQVSQLVWKWNLSQCWNAQLGSNETLIFIVPTHSLTRISQVLRDSYSRITNRWIILLAVFIIWQCCKGQVNGQGFMLSSFFIRFLGSMLPQYMALSISFVKYVSL